MQGYSPATPWLQRVTRLPQTLPRLVPQWRHPRGSGSARYLHKGHVGATLEKLDLPRHHWLKEVDQAPEKSSIRRKKDQYLRELGTVHDEIHGLFKDDESIQGAIKPISKEEARQQADVAQRREDCNEALRMYRLLRPDAQPFYEEDAALSMKAKANKILVEEQAKMQDTGDGALLPQATKYGDPFKAYLPVVNQRAFLLALESVVASLADDVETMCLLAGLNDEQLPEKGDPLRFKKLIDVLFGDRDGGGVFPLRKNDPNGVKEFMEYSWPRLRNILPEELALLPEERVESWLEGHLHRVRLNQKRVPAKIFLHQTQRFGDEEWYSFAEDFPYDTDPLPGSLADERNLDFPLERAEEYMQSLLGVLQQSPLAADQAMGSDHAVESPGNESKGIAAQFQDLVWGLESIGLRNWLRMDVQDLDRFLPKDRLAQLSLGEKPSGKKGENVICLSEDDRQVARLMLRCAARGRADLLDFEAVSPYKLLHALPARDIEEELSNLPPHEHIGDAELNSLVSAYEQQLGVGERTAPTTDDQWFKEGASIDELYKKELDFYRTAGPVEWTERDGEYTWKWQQPPNTIWDERRKVYIQEQKGVDPNLDLQELRQHMVNVQRMVGMTRVGRINYFRAIVVVGNGKGVYGFGVGFGNNPKEARADASLKALQNLDYIDFDPGRMACFPCRGREFKHEAKMIPRPIGRGLKVNKKFLPLMYILGLENVKVKFMGHNWFTRIRALKRCLDMMLSRRTLANMTGKRHALLVAPGDHWVHWPDRWFDHIREPYDTKAYLTRLRRRHALHFKTRGCRVQHARSDEVRPGWRKANWGRWVSKLERWLQQRRRDQPWDPGMEKKGKEDDSTVNKSASQSPSPLAELEAGNSEASSQAPSESEPVPKVE